MKIEPFVLDYETYWSTEHTLTKMSPMAYVMHPETEIISVAIRQPGKTSEVIFGENNVRDRLLDEDWSNKLLIAHNNEGFDALISAFRFGIRPKMWGCTLAMARPHHAKTAGGSLKALCLHYADELRAMGIDPIKDNTALLNTKGRHLKDFTQAELEHMAKYNGTDADQCYGLFSILAKKTSKDEMRLIDMTIRALVEPQFEIDRELLMDTLTNERSRKFEVLLDLSKKLGLDMFASEEEAVANVTKTLGSAAKFGQLLNTLGVETPMKTSPTTGKPAAALAKTDEAFIALQDHDDPMVAMAAAARLGVKSTLLESRIEAFLAASDAVGGKLPVPLKYYGADTTGRWSGWAYNPQNLPRVSGKPSDALRNSLKAPSGMKVIVADLSGIELRVNHFLWKVPSSVALYNADPEKADLYKDFASTLYGIDVSEVSKEQRQIGKVAHLGLGFGAGATTFQKVAKLMGGVDLSQEEAADVVRTWRAAYTEIADGWKACHDALKWISAGVEKAIDPWGLTWTCDEGIRTPKGLIRYPNLRKEEKDWVYGEGRNKARIYAGKVTENIVQHLARCVIADNALAFRKATGLSPALMVHDELVYVVPEAEAEPLLAMLQGFMRTPPVWWPELVTWSEGDIADTYGAAK